MPSRHSKNCGDRHHFTYQEKQKAGVGSVVQRLGSDSQLPFGYCPLTLSRITEAVVTPSGRLYEREAILEYLLTKTRELKAKQTDHAALQAKLELEEQQKLEEAQLKKLQKFSETQEGTQIVKRELTVEEDSKSVHSSRKRLIDETPEDIRKEELRKGSPWIVQFTPSYDSATSSTSAMPPPPQRPPSPFSGQLLRIKDLIPVALTPESSSSSFTSSSAESKFICPVSRKTITNQKVVLLKSTGTLMLESVAQELAYPTMTCPVTGKRFSKSDILEILPAVSGYAASGNVEAKKYRPSFN